MKKLFLFALSAIMICSCSKSGTEDNPPIEEEIWLYVSSNDLIFSEENTTTEIYIGTNGQWRITGIPSWCKCTPSQGDCDAEVSISINPDDIYEDQNANLTITAGDKTELVSITQKKKNALILSKDKYAVPLEGGNISIEVKSNIAYKIIIPDDFSSWIEEVAASSKTRALQSRIHTFKIADNLKVPKDRDGYIIVDGGDLKETIFIFQNYENKLILNQDNYILTSEQQSLDIELQTNIDYDVQIPNDAQNWIRQVATRAMRTDKLHFEIAENTASATRNTEIVIRDKNSDLEQILKVSQKPKGVWGKDVILESDADTQEFGTHKYQKIEGNLIIKTDDLTGLNDVLIEVEGDVTVQCPRLSSFDGLYGLEKIGGSLIIYDAAISSFEGLKNIHTIGKDFIINASAYGSNDLDEEFAKLKSFKGLDALKTIGGDFQLNISAKQYATQSHGGHATEAMNELSSFEGLETLEQIGGNFIITASATADGNEDNNSFAHALCALESFKGLNNLKRIGGNFSIKVNTTTSASYWSYPRSSSALTGLQSFDGLNSLEYIGENFDLISTASVSCNDSGGSWSASGLNSLMSFAGLDNLKFIGGSITISGKKYIRRSGTAESLSKLSSCIGLNTLMTVNGDISIMDCSALCDYTALQKLLSSYTGVFNTTGNKYNPTQQQIVDGEGAMIQSK